MSATKRQPAIRLTQGHNPPELSHPPSLGSKAHLLLSLLRLIVLNPWTLEPSDPRTLGPFLFFFFLFFLFSTRSDHEQFLAELDGLAAGDDHALNGAAGFGFDLVEGLHGLDQADRGLGRDCGADAGEGRAVGVG